jgi:hypothetical protein
MRRRLVFTAWGNLVVAALWLVLWLTKPGNWWNLLLGIVFAAFAVVILIELRRSAAPADSRHR